MKKKVLATLLVGTMAAGLLAGCSTTVEQTGGGQTSASEKTEKADSAEKTEDTQAAETGRQMDQMCQQTLHYGHIRLETGEMRRPLIL